MLYYIENYMGELRRRGILMLDRLAIVDKEKDEAFGVADFVATDQNALSLTRTAISRVMNIKEKCMVRIMVDGAQTDFSYDDSSRRFLPVSFKGGSHPDHAMVIVHMEDGLWDILGSYDAVDKMKQQYPVIVKVGDEVVTLPATDNLMSWREVLYETLKERLDNAALVDKFHIAFGPYLVQMLMHHYEWSVELLSYSSPERVKVALDDISVKSKPVADLVEIKDESRFLGYIFKQDVVDTLFVRMGEAMYGHLGTMYSTEDEYVALFLSSTVTMTSNYTTLVKIDTDKEDIDKFARDMCNGISNMAIYIATNFSTRVDINIKVKMNDFDIIIECVNYGDQWRIVDCVIKRHPQVSSKPTAQKEDNFFTDPQPKKEKRSALQDDNSPTFNIIGLSRNAVKRAVLDSVIKRENLSPESKFYLIVEELAKHYLEETGFVLEHQRASNYIHLIFEGRDIVRVSANVDGCVVFRPLVDHKPIAKIDINDSKAIAHVVIRCVKESL